MRVIFLGFVAGGTLLFGVAHAQEITLETAPPVVVKTVPEAGADQIDPGTTEIRVTFSKEMQDGSWSWSTVSKESFPEAAGKPKYDADQRTCILPVKLQPGKTYAIWVNSQKLRNFKDAKGQPAVPYLLVFKTKG
jgi:RNA polymerase sigma-70 factor (ECF subfamily)